MIPLFVEVGSVNTERDHSGPDGSQERRALVLNGNETFLPLGGLHREGSEIQLQTRTLGEYKIHCWPVIRQ